MNRVQYVYVLLILLSSSTTFGQGKGEVKIHVSPYKGLEYVLDGKERLHNPALVLPAGPHQFVFWAPGRQMLDTTLTIQTDSILKFYKVLPVSTEYRTYTKAEKRIKHNKLYLTLGPSLITAAGAIVTVNSIGQVKQRKETLVSLENSYVGLRSPSVIETLKRETIPSAQKAYDKAHKNQMIGITATSVAALVTVFCVVKASTLEKPMFEDKEKVKFDGLVWVPGQNGGAYAGLTFPIR